MNLEAGKQALLMIVIILLGIGGVAFSGLVIWPAFIRWSGGC